MYCMHSHKHMHASTRTQRRAQAGKRTLIKTPGQNQRKMPHSLLTIWTALSCHWCITLNTSTCFPFDEQTSIIRCFCCCFPLVVRGNRVLSAYYFLPSYFLFCPVLCEMLGLFVPPATHNKLWICQIKNRGDGKRGQEGEKGEDEERERTTYLLARMFKSQCVCSCGVLCVRAKWQSGKVAKCLLKGSKKAIHHAMIETV